MNIRELYSVALLLRVHRPVMIRRFEFGADADAIARAMDLDRGYVDAVISQWWGRTAATRRGAALARRAA